MPILTNRLHTKLEWNFGMNIYSIRQLFRNKTRHASHLCTTHCTRRNKMSIASYSQGSEGILRSTTGWNVTRDLPLHASCIIRSHLTLRWTPGGGSPYRRRSSVEYPIRVKCWNMSLIPTDTFLHASYIVGSATMTRDTKSRSPDI